MTTFLALTHGEAKPSNESMVGPLRKWGAPQGSGGTPARNPGLQGYLAHKQPPPPRTLQQDYAEGPTEVLGGGCFLMSEVPLYGLTRSCCSQDGRSADTETHTGEKPYVCET